MILTNPCSEIYLDDWFPEDRINKNNLSLTSDQTASYMAKLLSLVKQEVDSVFPGHQDMTHEELMVLLGLSYTFEDFSVENNLNLLMAILLTVHYKSKTAEVDTLLYCVKVCRNIAIRTRPGSMEHNYREFSQHVHTILGDLIPPRSGANAV